MQKLIIEKGAMIKEGTGWTGPNLAKRA